MDDRRLKPLARAMRAPAVVRRGRPVLSRALEEELFRGADVLSEGGCRPDPASHDSYFGSTMLSIDLDRLRPRFRGELEREAREQLAEAISGSVRVRLRAMRLACAEAARRVAGRELGTAMCEIRVRLTETQLHIDVDLEVPLGVSSGSRAR
ncbi:MAG: hypothetical protein PVI30_25685 [Myxococcales bacterium]|jgi:hypothetical protein